MTFFRPLDDEEEKGSDDDSEYNNSDYVQKQEMTEERRAKLREIEVSKKTEGLNLEK